MAVCDLPLPQLSLEGAFPGLREGVASCWSWASSVEEQSLSWVFTLLWPLGKLLHVLSSEGFLPAALAPGRGLAYQPLLVAVAPGGGGVMGPPRPPPAGIKGGSPPLGGRAVIFSSQPALWSRPLWGAL